MMKDFTFNVPQDIIFGKGQFKKNFRSFLRKVVPRRCF